MAVSAADAHVKKNNANRALPPEILSLAELRDCLAIEASERMALFDAVGLFQRHTKAGVKLSVTVC